MTLYSRYKIINCELNVKANLSPDPYLEKLILVEMIIYYDIKYENTINKVIFLLQI